MYFAPFVRNERNVFLENVYESIWRRELDRGEESKRSTERPDKLLLYSYQLERICLANLYYLTVVREVSAMEIGLGYYGTFRFVSCSLHLDSRTWRATTTTTTIKVSSLGNCRILDGPHGPLPPFPSFECASRHSSWENQTNISSSRRGRPRLGGYRVPLKYPPCVSTATSIHIDKY